MPLSCSENFIQPKSNAAKYNFHSAKCKSSLRQCDNAKSTWLVTNRNSQILYCNNVLYNGTLQIVCRQCCTALMSNGICTIQIASHQCCNARNNAPGSVQIGGHQFHIAIPYNVIWTVQIASHQGCTPITHNRVPQCKLQVTISALQ
jgi:hypothetical protein